MPDIKEKLLELLDKQKGYTLPIWTAPQTIEIMVDALIANGVTIAEDKDVLTNADRIRAMSDEELADWIARTQVGAIKDAMNFLRLPCDATDEVVELGKTKALEWLQQPAEEVDHE